MTADFGQMDQKPKDIKYSKTIKSWKHLLPVNEDTSLPFIIC